MSKFLKRAAQGAGVPHDKGTSNLETVKMTLPSKIVLSIAMLLGRLEIYPLLVLVMPTMWRRK